MELLQWTLYAIVILVVVTGLLIGYLIIAARIGDAAQKKGRNRQTWLFLSLIFGLILPGIIVAIMGPAEPKIRSRHPDASPPEAPPSGRTCPFCAEDIKPAALKCKHCGEMLET